MDFISRRHNFLSEHSILLFCPFFGISSVICSLLFLNSQTPSLSTGILIFKYLFLYPKTSFISSLCLHLFCWCGFFFLLSVTFFGRVRLLPLLPLVPGLLVQCSFSIPGCCTSPFSSWYHWSLYLCVWNLFPLTFSTSLTFSSDVASSFVTFCWLCVLAAWEFIIRTLLAVNATILG